MKICVTQVKHKTATKYITTLDSAKINIKYIIINKLLNQVLKDSWPAYVKDDLEVVIKNDIIYIIDKYILDKYQLATSYRLQHAAMAVYSLKSKNLVKYKYNISNEDKAAIGEVK